LGLQINVEFKRFMSKYKKNSFIDPKQKRESTFSAIYLNNAIYEKIMIIIYFEKIYL